MVELKLNYSKLKIKYIFGNYKEIDSYPSSEDTIYSLIQWFIGIGKNNNLEFSNKHAQKFLDIDDIDKVDSILAKCVDDGYIEYLKDTNIKSVYKLVKNPFI
jgi:hypothetical protein